MRLAVPSATVLLLKKVKVRKRGIVGVVLKEELDVNERHDYSVTLVLDDLSGAVEGAMITEKRPELRGDKTYQLVEVTRLRQ